MIIGSEKIKQAFENGKTVIVYLPRLYEVYVDTGQRSYSGTGRNQKTTRHVSISSNYEAIPASLGPVSTSGSSMSLVGSGLEVLSSYWSEFEKWSKYQAILTGEKVPACIQTRTGGKAVGALYRSKSSAGALLLLPEINFESDEFTEERDGKRFWSESAGQFANRLIASVVAIDKALKGAQDVTPEPQWAAENTYQLAPELQLRAQLIEAEKEVEAAQRKKDTISAELKSAGSLRALLYEKGKVLEAAIIDALRIIGFAAEPYKDGSSEFDVVFESKEGRLIGEAEGKDNKPVNVDKLRQLSMNIHEDLLRESVSTPAKPVLFGNGYRLTPLQERADPFTDKVHAAAVTSSTALVSTPDLYLAIQYLAASNDDNYAAACRKAILERTGRVSFPNPPEAPSNAANEQA